MKLTAQVYRWVNDGMTVQYDTRARDRALNFVGPTWVDCKLGFVKNVLRNHDVILTDSDLLSHEDYISKLTSEHIVVVAFNSQASKKRLRKAVERLKAAGIKTRYFASLETAGRYIQKIGETDALTVEGGAK